MDGYDAYAISGLDGDFACFDQFMGKSDFHMRKLAYDRRLTFMQNLNVFRSEIEADGTVGDTVALLGWSIGGAMALKLGECRKCRKCVVMNSFFHRRTYLRQRNLEIMDEEDIDIGSLKLEDKRILIVAGADDEKIPYMNSVQIFDILRGENDVALCVYSNARHSLDSFPDDAKSLVLSFLAHD